MKLKIEFLKKLLMAIVLSEINVRLKYMVLHLQITFVIY
uniref:Uncharacterized protein n=1 Tax=Myoviridae sp. ctIty1 TaxID=2827673 RepID=A0A8S5TGA6_9CAUD|nr:MAG TPA: hypothetical protein [Myoviridae sp. ctIty1]